MSRPECRIAGCEKTSHARGLCPAHYQRWRKGAPVGVPLVKWTRPTGECVVANCQRPKKHLDYCKSHYARHLTGRPMAPEVRRYWPGTLCKYDGCERAFYATGMCRFHYDRTRQGIPIDAPVRDGRITDRKGYVLIRIPGAANRYVAEHRLVMEQVLGRPLLAFENVHHKNGVRDDNRPANLELWVTSQPSGQRPADLVQWARSIIELYG